MIGYGANLIKPETWMTGLVGGVGLTFWLWWVHPIVFWIAATIVTCWLSFCGATVVNIACARCGKWETLKLGETSDCYYCGEPLGGSR